MLFFGRNKESVIRDLEALAQEDGFIYSFALLLRKDLFYAAEEAADVNWRERITFQEATFLAGLMVKKPINPSIFPTPENAKSQVERTRKLFAELHGAYNAPFFERLKEKLTQTTTNERDDFQDFFSKGELITEPIFYGSSGAYDFQLLEFALEKYRDDQEWIKKKIGSDFSLMLEITQTLKTLSQVKIRRARRPKDIQGVFEQVMNVFCFSKADFPSVSDADFQNFINAFSLKPGTTNGTLKMPGEYNELNAKPIIELDDGRYFLPISFLLAESVYESPFFWMSADLAYVDTANEHRGKATERMSKTILESIFGARVYSNVKIYKNKNKAEAITDIDVLAIAGNKAVIVQAKSKRLSIPSKQGNDEQLRSDFKKGLQKAYDQGLACRKALLDKNNALLAEDGTWLDLKEPIDDAYILCVMLDDYPALIHQVEVFLQKTEADPFPIAMNIFDLDIVGFYLKDPFEFLYYIRQRIKHFEYFKGENEVVLLGFHLRQKLMPDKKYHGMALDSTYAQLVDANFPSAKGHHPKTKVMDKLRSSWKNQQFDELVLQVKSTGDAGFTDVLFFLYDLAGDGADELMRHIQQTKKLTAADGKVHDFTMLFSDADVGLTFVSARDNPRRLHTTLEALSTAHKHRDKFGSWIALGSFAGSPNLIDILGFISTPWEESAELDELVKKVLPKPGKPLIPRWEVEKVGRNEPCPCQSGKKYKKCHGG